MDIADKVVEILRAEGQPLNAGKIAELCGLDRKGVDKAMTKLKKEGCAAVLFSTTSTLLPPDTTKTQDHH